MRTPLLRVAAIILGIALIALSMPARALPGDTATPAATPAADCLLGEWEATDLGPFVEASFPGVMGIKGIRYERSSGSLRFTYAPDGQQRIVADDYRVEVVAAVRIVGDVEAAIVFDGAITGRWSLNGDVLALSESDRSDFSIRAELPFGSVGVDAGDFFGDGDSRFACDAETLAIYPDPDLETPILFQRPSGTPTAEPATPTST